MSVLHPGPSEQRAGRRCRQQVDCRYRSRTPSVSYRRKLWPAAEAAAEEPAEEAEAAAEEEPAAEDEAGTDDEEAASAAD